MEAANALSTEASYLYLEGLSNHFGDIVTFDLDLTGFTIPSKYDSIYVYFTGNQFNDSGNQLAETWGQWRLKYTEDGHYSFVLDSSFIKGNYDHATATSIIKGTTPYRTYVFDSIKIFFAGVYNKSIADVGTINSTNPNATVKISNFNIN